MMTLLAGSLTITTVMDSWIKLLRKYL